MVKEVKANEAEKADETTDKDKEGTVKAQESAVKDYPEGITEHDSGKSAEKDEASVESAEEPAEKDEDSAEKSEDSKDSADSHSTGISDEELSRVFEAIPKKSKVALDRAESKMDNVKGAKSSPVWYPWVFSIIMVIGLTWAVVYYLTGNYPIPHIGAWNLCISFVTILVGFSMTMFWK
jgi:cobalamin biosynthesis Mg chelatase CobN